MSAIAWDGHTLACDRGMWHGSMQTEVCKLFVFKSIEIVRKGFPAGAWGATGGWAFSNAFSNWLTDLDAPFPEFTKDQDLDHSGGIWVANTGEAYRLYLRGILTPITGKIAADGAAQMFLLGVLALGGSAERAVSLAEVHTDAAAFGVDTWAPPGRGIGKL